MRRMPFAQVSALARLPVLPEDNDHSGRNLALVQVIGIFGINSWKYSFVKFLIKATVVISKKCGATSTCQAHEMMSCMIL